MAGTVLQPVNLKFVEIRKTVEAVSFCCNWLENQGANKANKFNYCPNCGLPVTKLDPITRVINTDA